VLLVLRQGEGQAQELQREVEQFLDKYQSEIDNQRHSVQLKYHTNSTVNSTVQQRKSLYQIHNFELG
jgi:hypothetical protein